MAYEMMCGKAPFYNISRQKTIENIKSVRIVLIIVQNRKLSTTSLPIGC